MKRTHLASFSSRNQTQEEEEDDNTNGHDNSIIKNHYRNYEAGLIPWPPKNYICSFCRREFKSAQALGGHMNVHRRDRAKLRQIPSWLFESNPNFSSSSSASSSSSLTIPAHHEPPSLTNQRTKPTPFSSSRFDLCDKTTSFGGLMGEREKSKNNVWRREIKKSAMDACHAPRCEMNKRDEVIGLELEMGLRNPKQALDLELRLGYL